ncbi:hypothetical protein PCANC_02788 [Puccinia coronata f. sp. avenae]|uniref:Uncharacterized protein n=1 Tax=Puccinia coronata f. sp. avenae TaxID=200324 RepID=A0A2N5W408_9BASI|nr:hypothetical protein PCANC_02788 [Puccinia coronata f. sp. avenae]
MINSASLQDAEALLKQLSQRETRQSMIIQDGYNQPYLNSEGIVAPTLEILKRHASSWISTQYSAPYTAPIGPSMSGKTRLLMEWSKQICVVYICIRPTTSTGHPPQSRYAVSILFNASNKHLETEYEFFSTRNPEICGRLLRKSNGGERGKVGKMDCP